MCGCLMKCKKGWTWKNPTFCWWMLVQSKVFLKNKINIAIACTKWTCYQHCFFGTHVATLISCAALAKPLASSGAFGKACHVVGQQLSLIEAAGRLHQCGWPQLNGRLKGHGMSFHGVFDQHVMFAGCFWKLLLKLNLHLWYGCGSKPKVPFWGWLPSQGSLF